MPWTWTLPLALAILAGYVPWGCGALHLVLTALLALLYFVWRPLPNKSGTGSYTIPPSGAGQ